MKARKGKEKGKANERKKHRAKAMQGSGKEKEIGKANERENT